MSLVSSRSTTYTEVGDVFSLVFDYCDIMCRLGAYAGFELPGGLLYGG